MDTMMSICDIAFLVPTEFDVFSVLYRNVLPLIAIFIFFIVFLFKKKKKEFLKKVVVNPLTIILIGVYFIVYPKVYFQERDVDREVIKKCECLGFKSEVFGGNQICSRKQECVGIPYSCQIAKDSCRTIHEGEITIHDIKINPNDAFTEDDARDLVKDATVAFDVVSMNEAIQDYIDGSLWKLVTVTYKVDKDDFEIFEDTIVYLPLNRGPIYTEEKVVCDKTNL